MITLTNLSYSHPNRDVLFDNLNLTINKADKVALIGNNGVGKSTLLKIIARECLESAGQIRVNADPYYVPQHLGQFNNLTIAEALRIDRKLKALKEAVDGKATIETLALLNDDWLIEDRCKEALQQWGLAGLALDRKMYSLSGGQKTKLFLSGITLYQPEVVLLDEPSNHLDLEAREHLYEYVTMTSTTLVLVSHDRTLLNLVNTVYELNKKGVTIYGGNYDFYVEQKNIAEEALQHDLKSKDKALRKAKEVERETLERKQKLDARGKKKQQKAGMPTIVLNTLRNNAEKSTSRIRNVQSEKVRSLSEEVRDIRRELPDMDKIRLNLDNSSLHAGKTLVLANDINFKYDGVPLWSQPLDLMIRSNERIAIKGTNGSGKSTLIKILTGTLQPDSGCIHRVFSRSVYIDQEYSLIDNRLTVYEQAQHFNHDHLREHDIKIRLNRFLFSKEYWDKLCVTLSGGEKMRLMLCCLMIGNHAPDMILLDEPTNNLDIQNTDILARSIADYQGTLIVVSHDRFFLDNMRIEREITLNP